MRLSVTPLGGAGRSAGQVAGAVVDYLEGGVGDPGAGLLAAAQDAAGSDSLVAYYGDSKEGPGRWIGAGATAQGLGGVVDRMAFARVLEGRHPVTGARLLSAQGSSQRGHLAAGTAARFDSAGCPLYSVADAARLLDLSQRDVAAMTESGELATVEVGGDVFVPDDAITRHLDDVAAPGERITAGGDPDDWLSGPQAARLLGVSPQYVRRICGRSDKDNNRGGDLVARLPSERVGNRGAFRIRRGDLAEFAANRTPPVARVGYDVTLTTEKSFGVVMMLAGPAVQLRFAAALREANDVAIRHLDRYASVGRRKGAVVASDGLVGATYFHGTSRGFDPHPHHHNVVANAIVDDRGERRALDARALYLEAPEAAALATAAARWELRDLGLGWWQRDDGMWEIDGVDETVIDAFSSRHRDIRDVREALEDQLGRTITSAEDRHIWAETRAHKTAVDPGELVVGWRERAATAGFDVDACFGRDDAAIVVERLDDEMVNVLYGDLLDPEAGVCAATDRFDRGDVVRAVADWSIRDEGGDRRKVLMPPAEIARLADGFLGQRHVVGLSASLCRGAIQRADGRVVEGDHVVRTYTTAEMVWTQSQIISTWTGGRAAGRGIVDDDLIDTALDAVDRVEDGDITLTVDQQALVRAWCTSGDKVQGAVGRAGAGKTTAMAAAAAAWQSAGYRVIGAAVKGEAARQLGFDAGIDADTVALLLARIRRHEPVLDARTVVIVDEGSTLGDRDLLELMLECDRAGATLRIIGDPVQHRSVPAGDCWSYLVTSGGTPSLTKVHRLRDDGERRRADALRHTKPTRIVASLEAAGQLVWSNSDRETYAAMLDRWYQSRIDGAGHPMVHGRNRQRRMLNQIAQQILVDAGTVDPTRAVELADGRRLCVGDEVIARHGDRRIHPPDVPAAWMRNGTTGQIAAIEPNTGGGVAVTIATAAGDLVVDREVIERRRGGIDLAYAVTSYAVQGSTRDRSTSGITASTTRAELYVDVTRGRDSNVVFATRHVDHPESDEHLPVIDRDLADELTARLARPDGKPVVVADPAVVAVTATAGATLAKLHAEQRAGNDGAWDEAIERREAMLRTVTAPPARFDNILPPAPNVPHLQARYQRLAGSVAVWTETHNPARPRSPQNRLEAAIGLRPDSNVAGAHWDGLADRMVQLAVDVTVHRIHQHEPTVDAGEWLTVWLGKLACAGRLATIGSDQLAEIVSAVAAWRNDRNVTSVEPLGHRPRDTETRHTWRQLDARLSAIAGQRDVEQGVA